jgi:hypothetical protein
MTGVAFTLAADLEELERDGTAARLRAVAATLTVEEHHRLAAEAEAGDRLAELMVAVLATPRVPGDHGGRVRTPGKGPSVPGGTRRGTTHGAGHAALGRLPGRSGGQQATCHGGPVTRTWTRPRTRQLATSRRQPARG